MAFAYWDGGRSSYGLRRCPVIRDEPFQLVHTPLVPFWRLGQHIKYWAGNAWVFCAHFHSVSNEGATVEVDSRYTISGWMIYSASEGRRKMTWVCVDSAIHYSDFLTVVSIEKDARLLAKLKLMVSLKCFHWHSAHKPTPTYRREASSPFKWQQQMYDM